MGDFLQKEFEIIIVGGGPAGLSAALYAARGNVSTLVIEKGLSGGELNNTEDVENYPGIDQKTGPQIAEMMVSHAKRFGAEFLELTEILEVDLKAQPKIFRTNRGNFKAKAVIIATGSEHRKLGVPGEKEFAGKGVSYCAVCDGAFFKEKDVIVVGGGNAAVEEGNFLTRFAKSVKILHRRDKLRAEKIIEERARNNPKIEFVWNTVVEEIQGDPLGTNSVKTRNLKNKQVSKIECDGVFIYVGLEPNVSLFKNQIELDSANRIICNHDLQTSLPGVWAGGDVRVTPLRQAVTAASDGSIAATKAIEFCETLKS